ncbi:MAG: cytochrome c [Candidatus Binatia bacterium]
MSIRAINWVLLVGFLLTVGLNFALRPDLSRPNFEFFPDMAHSVRSNAFSPNTVFADGQTLQQPPDGTIPRGWPPLHYRATPEDALRAGVELANPFAVADSQVHARGAFVFTTWCQPCHGGGGRGDGPVAQRGFPPPPSLLADKAVNMRDGQLFHIMTYGQANMPSYASQISREDRWKAVSYVRWLQSQATASAPQP